MVDGRVVHYTVWPDQVDCIMSIDVPGKHVGDAQPLSRDVVFYDVEPVPENEQASVIDAIRAHETEKLSQTPAAKAVVKHAALDRCRFGFWKH
ncbi:MAG: hypothetical protein PHT12_03510 [Patescibacteria group bacterium]|nr:hypothetical protein [Patescibacteria group bacterium]